MGVWGEFWGFFRVYTALYTSEVAELSFRVFLVRNFFFFFLNKKHPFGVWREEKGSRIKDLEYTVGCFRVVYSGV